MSTDDQRILENFFESDELTKMQPKYFTLVPSNAYRYTISYDKKGVSFDISANYPKSLDPIVSFFDKYSA
eukprot:gene7284-8466_t